MAITRKGKIRVFYHTVHIKFPCVCVHACVYLYVYIKFITVYIVLCILKITDNARSVNTEIVYFR